MNFAASHKIAAALTPYIVPPCSGRVVANLGDGLILRAIERLIGPFSADQLFTTRTAPRAGELEDLARSAMVVIAGANQLDDGYTVWPGLTPSALAESNLRLVPFGVGLHGGGDKNLGLSPATREILEIMHQRIRYSSWRCPRTIEVLRRDLPHLAERFLMTGCPVIFDRPLLDGTRFSDNDRSIAVTVTDRGEFWERESALIDKVARLFPRSKRTLVLHENFSAPTKLERFLGYLPPADLLLDKRGRLRAQARRLGYTVAIPSTVDEGIQLYRNINFHIGSRLHAHLYFLSQSKKSFLIPVDGRATGFSEFLGFPLCEVRDIEMHFGFDFECVREGARETFGTMRLFLDSLGRR